MSDANTTTLDKAAEAICRWGAARAGAIVVLPVIGSAALIANEIYRILRIGNVYGAKLTYSAAKGFLMSFAGAILGLTLVNLFPFPVLQIPIGVAVTYGIGKAAQAWIKDGMPSDVMRYKEVFERAKADAERNTASFKNDPQKDVPLGDEKQTF